MEFYTLSFDMSSTDNIFSVALTERYDYSSVDSETIYELCVKAGISIPSHSNVLVKPNLISIDSPFAITNPRLVWSVCLLLVEHGNNVICADSPAFGSPGKIAGKSGLADLLAQLDITVEELDNPVTVTLPSGIRTGVSAKALDADCIVNLPKLKAHCQTGITCAVKNMFGTVCGFRKALAHFFYGDRDTIFPSIITDIALLSSPAINIVDAVVSMHVTGPVDGKSYSMNMLGAASSPFSLDTAIYEILGLTPEDKRISLWQEARRRNIPEAFRDNISYPLCSPADFDSSGFELPSTLKPETFNPFKLLKGRIKSLLRRI
jgi:uncharacterized protein (DUF362 family)